ncbi:MAG: HD-GYP domain-containing protein [Planctomycetota bacterium]
MLTLAQEAQLAQTREAKNTSGKADNVPTLIPVALNTLLPTSVLNYDLYLWSGGHFQPVLYRKRDLPFTTDDVDRLLDAEVSTLYVLIEDHVKYRREFQEGILNHSVSPLERYRALKELNRCTFEAAFQGRNLNRAVQIANKHASQLVTIMCDRDLVLQDLFRLMDHDYYTYAHATNVSAYSVMLAFELGYCDETDLASIGTAALLHDLGKRSIPSSILNKPGSLTQWERNLVQDHPRTSFDELSVRGDFSWDQLMLIYQHHERINGSGYPVGLYGDEIHPWAKICAIADVFDALTSERPYRQPDSVEKTCEMLFRSVEDFDKEMVKCWTSTVMPRQ